MKKADYVEKKRCMYEDLALQWAAYSHRQIANDKRTVCLMASFSYYIISQKYAGMAFDERD